MQNNAGASFAKGIDSAINTDSILRPWVLGAIAALILLLGMTWSMNPRGVLLQHSIPPYPAPLVANELLLIQKRWTLLESFQQRWKEKKVPLSVEVDEQ